MGEFELIRHCFMQGFPTSDDTLIGIGDDASVVAPPNDHQLIQSIDTQVADVHFPALAPPHLIAQRALRCAVSDLAAMGATPQGFFLALTLPKTPIIPHQPRADWLNEFANGLRQAACASGISLLGGDTTSGQQLVVSCQVQGWISPDHSPLLRSGARHGDHIWVSGSLGAGALSLPFVLKNPATTDGFAQRYYFPEPRLALGQSLLPIASAAMDISDGLLQDARHIAQASQVAMQLNAEAIPTAVAMGHPDWPTCVTGGDDYELLFCAPADQHSAIQLLGQRHQIAVHHIGLCTESGAKHGVNNDTDYMANHLESNASPGTARQPVELLHRGQPLTLATHGFQHF